MHHRSSVDISPTVETTASPIKLLRLFQKGMNRCFDRSGRSFCKGKCIIFAEGVVTPVLVTVEVSMKQLECSMAAYPPEGNSSPFSLASLRNREVTNSKINTYRLLWTGLILTYN